MALRDSLMSSPTLPPEAGGDAPGSSWLWIATDSALDTPIGGPGDGCIEERGREERAGDAGVSGRR